MTDSSVARQPSTSAAAAAAAASIGWARQLQASSVPPPVSVTSPTSTTAAQASSESAANSRARIGQNGPRNTIASDQNAKASTKAALLAVGAAADKRQSAATASSTAAAAALAAKSTPSATASPTPHPSSSSPSSPTDWGNSAATQAFRSNLSPKLSVATSGSPKLNGRSLMAAKEAMSTARPRSVSSPMTSPRAAGEHPVSPLGGSSAAAASALSAATIAHRRPSNTTRLEETGASPVVAMARNMYTASPPVSIEVDEQKAAEKRHAEAVAMARTIFMQHQRMIDAASEQAQAAAYGHNDTDTVVSDSAEANFLANPVSLQEAAYKLAQERLRKLQEEIERNKEHQGQFEGARSPPPRRLGLASLRKRSASLGQAQLPQQQQQQQQQQRHSIVSTASQPSQTADEAKRERDRNALMDAARRNVRDRLRGMDNDLAETGKAAPAPRSDWRARAQALAQARFDSTREQSGKRDVGAGMFVSQSEIDAIATRRVQPLLDDLEEKAKVERERLDMIRIEEEARKQEQSRLRAQERDLRDMNRKARETTKQEARTRKAQEQDDERASGDDVPSSSAKVKSWLRSRLAPRKDAADTTPTTTNTTAAAAVADKDSSSIDEPLSPNSQQRVPDAVAPTSIGGGGAAIGDDPVSPTPDSPPRPIALHDRAPVSDLQQQQQQPPAPRSVSPLSAGDAASATSIKSLPITPAEQVADPLATASATATATTTTTTTMTSTTTTTTPPKTTPVKRESPVRDSRFRELFDDVAS